jgi:hypothetical protein
MHTPDPTRPDFDAAELLNDVEKFIRRFVVFPSEAAYVAVTLWVAHTHLMDLFDSTPRLAFLSPEPGSGKSRSLEVVNLMVPRAMYAVSATTAALYRSVADQAGRPTILFDEIDTVFGPKAKDNEELRGLLNQGHRRSGVTYRCVGDGAAQTVAAFPSYAAVAMGGLGWLPDTILTRSVIVRMRRRAEGEEVSAFRERVHEPEGHELRKRLAEWTDQVGPTLIGVYPEMPDGVKDRPADVWEPLLIMADAAGGHWPKRSRDACLFMLATATPAAVSLGIRLLTDIRDVFAKTGAEAMFTAHLLSALYEIDDAPWADLKQGRPLTNRTLAQFLGEYEIKSGNVYVGADQAKGYQRAWFADAWARYCRTPRPKSDGEGQ